MNPGRELDALIAEKVMGWRWMIDYGGPKESAQLVQPSGEVHHIDRMPPFYSTDISAAWKVVEKLKDSDAYGFALVQDQGEALEWVASFGEDKFEVWAETAPLAICLAALKAVDAGKSSS